MDELDRELSALREATQSVKASQGLKSELLLAAARAGAGAGAAGAVTTISLKLVLVLVAAGATGGLAVWGLTREPESPPPPPLPPVVSVSVAVVASPVPLSDASTPGAVAVTPSQPAPGPSVVTSVLSPAAPEKCSGTHVERWHYPVRRPLPTALRDRIAALGDVPAGQVFVALVQLPPDRKPDQLIAQAPLLDRWLVARLREPGRPVWIQLPGYEPVAFDTSHDAADLQYFVFTGFRPIRSEVDLAIHVTAPFGDVSVALKGEPCADAISPFLPTEGPELPSRAGRDVVFEGLTQTPWRVIVRSPGNTSAEVEVMPERAGRIDVPILLERARNITVEYAVALVAGLCRTPREHRPLVPGEHFTLGRGPWLWLGQKNQRVQFDRYATLSGGYLGQGTLERFCHDPTPTEPFTDRELRTGDVYMVLHEGNVVLMRFTVQ